MGAVWIAVIAVAVVFLVAFAAHHLGRDAGEREGHERLRATERAVTELLMARRCLMEELTRTRRERDEAREAMR